ncbi:N-fatty-acyl-amino acid synthase/hydrolase PM20D1.2-like isoform X1 [Ylistrum balloti]|uniref:N-fatty-acyl-amino acid synthase/hydrolase PM20D1.2-like isoform X1 n=2 Tax=Ylistrum balloti TaxID=509963 RepID=UPI0029059635|nr:N-fatty-acyl-amino acid synthase/hydrolase PM20D1.2-like isoform X1 [Ylistrum balloti]
MQHLLKSILSLFSVVLSVVITVIVLRTLTFSVRTDDVTPCAKSDEDFVQATPAVVERFRRSLRMRTVATSPHVYDEEELQKLTSFIKSAYPNIHSSSFVTCEDVANHSLLYTVRGENSSLTPYMITGHLDVVPADPSLWDHPPFGAEIHDGFIYARGTIDDKHIVMGVLEALEHLLSRGFKPQRSFYIGFGHDEEVTGLDGARSISNLLWSRGIRKLEFLVDEGLTIVNNVIPGIDRPVALIGTAEKGYLTLKLNVKWDTGHSSMPTKETSIGIMANAISKLTTDCHPSMFGQGPEIDTFQHLASHMKWPFRVVMSNLWLFKPIISWFLSKKPSTNAIVRTVTSVTMINGGVKVNVLPPEVTAYVNHRLHPAQSIQQVIDFDRQLIGDDRVKITVESSMEPLPMSPYGDYDFGFQMVKSSIRQVWTEAAVAPGVMIGNTDTIHYTPFTHNIYRFSPTFMFPDDIPRFHGNNERLSVNNYEQAINFYKHLIQNADVGSLQTHHKHGEEL